MLRSTAHAAVLLAAIAAADPAAHAQKFYPDDPLWIDPDNTIDVGMPTPHSLSDTYDFVLHTFGSPGDLESGRAVNINTLGEVPDSSWFANRHGRNRMSVDQLVRGPDTSDGPSRDGVWTITDAKTQGITPGFTIEDSSGETYFLKFDPPDNPEMATAAEVISTKLFYAMGYHVPENYLVQMDPNRLELDPEATVEAALGVERSMTRADVDAILARIHRLENGNHRAVASKVLAGDAPLGPFVYYGTRPDDANDIFLHENRRELRGLRALAAWVNHDDSRAINSLDMLVTENGSSFIRHHLIDFGSTLGSGSVAMQKPRAGYEYMWEAKPAVLRILSLGLWDREWVRINYPDYPSIGRFESDVFEPEQWKPEYPNPAFIRATAEDLYWGAKIAMRFTDEEIGAIVRTGQLSDPEAEEYLIQRLIDRRDKVGRHWFSLVNTADNFEVVNDDLQFDRLASTYGFSPAPTETGIQWFRFDNFTGESTPLGPETGYDAGAASLPDDNAQYLRARLREETRFVDVYLRQTGNGREVVGIERSPDTVAP